MEYYRKMISDSNVDPVNSNQNSIPSHEISTDCEAIYVIEARVGEMYLEGKNGIEANPQEAVDLFSDAAERAMQNGNGRLATKLYALAEKASAKIQ